jgi:hypothetical protein
MFIRTIVFSAALALTGGAALAQGLAQATLQAPISKPAQAIAGGAEWNCQGSSCATQVDPDSNAYTDIFAVSSCEQLVKTAGPVSAYSRDGKTFTATQLDHCNSVAPKAAGVTQTAAIH